MPQTRSARKALRWTIRDNDDREPAVTTTPKKRTVPLKAASASKSAARVTKSTATAAIKHTHAGLRRSPRKHPGTQSPSPSSVIESTAQLTTPYETFLNPDTNHQSEQSLYAIPETVEDAEPSEEAERNAKKDKARVIQLKEQPHTQPHSWQSGIIAIPGEFIGGNDIQAALDRSQFDRYADGPGPSSQVLFGRQLDRSFLDDIAPLPGRMPPRIERHIATMEFEFI